MKPIRFANKIKRSQNWTEIILRIKGCAPKTFLGSYASHRWDRMDWWLGEVLPASADGYLQMDLACSDAFAPNFDRRDCSVLENNWALTFSFYPSSNTSTLSCSRRRNPPPAWTPWRRRKWLASKFWSTYWDSLSTCPACRTSTNIKCTGPAQLCPKLYFFLLILLALILRSIVCTALVFILLARWLVHQIEWVFFFLWNATELRKKSQ